MIKMFSYYIIINALHFYNLHEFINNISMYLYLSTYLFIYVCVCVLVSILIDYIFIILLVILFFNIFILFELLQSKSVSRHYKKCI